MKSLDGHSLWMVGIEAVPINDKKTMQKIKVILLKLIHNIDNYVY